MVIMDIPGCKINGMIFILELENFWGIVFFKTLFKPFKAELYKSVKILQILHMTLFIKSFPENVTCRFDSDIS